MILSPYHNPPYRSPTPKASSSPPPQPSPKRKRSDSGATPRESLRVQTNLRDELSDTVSGCDSPRSKVAEKFRGLNIDRASLEHRDGNDEASAARKRLKRSSHVKPPPSVRESAVVAPPDRGRRIEPGLSEPVAEIQETPQVQGQPSSSPSSPVDARAIFVNSAHATSQHQDHDRIGSPSSTPLPPSPRGMISPPSQQPIPDRALSPLQLSEEPSLDQAALTWHDSEITGHEIDASHGDDGLGINGIGFRPTPAIAHARAQKRKQQVSDWKAREARDARQRRMDRRRGAGSGDDVRDGVGARRAVRFEDAG